MCTYSVSIQIQIKKNPLSCWDFYSWPLGYQVDVLPIELSMLGFFQKKLQFRRFIDIHPSQEVKEEKENDFFSKMGQKMLKQDWIVFKIYYQIIFTKIIIVPIQPWLEH